MRRIWKTVGMAAALAAAAAVTADSAQAAGSVSRGRAKAVQYCSSCHKVTARQVQPPPVLDKETSILMSPPPFADVAGKYAGNAAGLRGFIHLPRYPMPEQELGPRDLNDIAAYILSLNKPQKP